MASADIENVGSGADKLKLAMAVTLLLAGVVGYYLLASQAGWLGWLVFLVGVAAGAATFLISEPGKRLVAYGRDSVREAQKVVWPTRRESLQMTGYVFAFALVMALFLFLTDKTIEWVLFDLILGWR